MSAGDDPSELDPTFEMDRDLLPTGELPAIVRVQSTVKPRIRPVRFTIKIMLFALVLYFAVTLLPKFLEGASELRDVNPILIAVGFALELLALFFYSSLTRATLGDAADPLSSMRMFRIQLSTRALTNVVPGGNAAGSALGYRLLTLSGIRGPDAGFALATAGIGSAVILNLIFWLGLVVSVPRRGVNPLYGTAALAGIIIIGIAAFLVIGLMEGQGRAERVIRWCARLLRTDEDRMVLALRQIAGRLEELISDRALLKRVVVYALLNWLVDAAALWVFLRAFGGSLDIDALIVAFGLANLIAAIPITPGGFGYVDAIYVVSLVGFGLTENTATLGVVAYRFAQFFFPIFLGAAAYASLRLGPWKIEKRDRLSRLRELARTEPGKGESKIDFALRFGQRERPTPVDIDPEIARAVADGDTAIADGDPTDTAGRTSN
ncbi:MAG: lysylphosphatidylglycerol synthase transmembrane domain-containing protein [Ilumatobacter sp.]|uniref:lysylphosphatidylglycerol synthase transmembrane domain-containing protein n=1 Tax=Ilumatobacter sp. TaxID=1967498 RepID=UPI003C75423B